METPASEDDILQEIADEDLEQLRDLYKVKWPSRAHIYYFIDNVIKWKRKYNYPARFYCPDGQWDDGTFVVMYWDFSASITAFSLDATNKRLCKALKETKRINWMERGRVSGVHREQISTFMEVYTHHSMHLKFIAIARYWWISIDTALAFDIEEPEGMYLGAVDDTHAEQINAVWPHRRDDSVKYIRLLIGNNGGLGLFQRADGALCAWILHNDYGTLGILQTEEKYQGRGYAKLVTKALCRKLAEAGICPVSFIVTGNTVSEGLFKSLGFQPIDYISWMLFGDCN